MISRFPDLMNYILDEAPSGLAIWAEVLFTVLGFCLAVALMCWLVLFTPKRWRKRFLLLLSSFLGMSIAFGFVYHLLFQRKPTNFKLNAPIEISGMFIPIGEHQELLDKIRVHREIIAWTLAGLRRPQGERRLEYLARHISGDVRSAYIATLSLAVVAPVEPLSPEDAETLSLLRGESRAEVERHLKAQEYTLGTRPGLLAPIPAWDHAMGLPVETLVDMRLLLKKFLGGPEPAVTSAAELSTYLTPEDSIKLQKYMIEDLEMQLADGGRVDLQQANDQADVIEVANWAAMRVAAADWRRLVDFQYFSWTTITLVGYGDILPNSTLARACVAIQILCGTLMLVFAVGRLLEEKDEVTKTT